MNQKDINEFHKMLCEYAEKKELEITDILSLLASIFVGTLATNGYTDVQTGMLLLKMRREFVNHPRRKKKE